MSASSLCVINIKCMQWQQNRKLQLEVIITIIIKWLLTIKILDNCALFRKKCSTFKHTNRYGSLARYIRVECKIQREKCSGFFVPSSFLLFWGSWKEKTLHTYNLSSETFYAIVIIGSNFLSLCKNSIMICWRVYAVVWLAHFKLLFMFIRFNS